MTRTRVQKMIPKTIEYQKMISGQPYKAYDEELTQARCNAKKLMRRFNDTMGDLENVGPAELIKRRAELLAEVFVFDESSAPEIEPPMAFDYGFNVHFGKKFFANYNCTFLDVAIITIGNNVMLGPNQHIPWILKQGTPELNLVYQLTYALVQLLKHLTTNKQNFIKIQDNVWIGMGVIVLPGVTIGEGSVIGAGAVVTKDIPPNTLAVGSPAKPIRKIENE
nr:galactoside O-acetyltransferase homolog - fission yeast (Schizosaccharomyces pombe) [Schizosaccharomyces pombe]